MLIRPALKLWCNNRHLLLSHSRLEAIKAQFKTCKSTAVPDILNVSVTDCCAMYQEQRALQLFQRVLPIFACPRFSGMQICLWQLGLCKRIAMFTGSPENTQAETRCYLVTQVRAALASKVSRERVGTELEGMLRGEDPNTCNHRHSTAISSRHLFMRVRAEAKDICTVDRHHPMLAVLQRPTKEMMHGHAGPDVVRAVRDTQRLRSAASERHCPSACMPKRL